MPLVPPSNPLFPYFHSTDYISAGRSGSMDFTKYHREYEQVFQVIVKVKGMGPLTVCGAPGMPLPYGPYVAPDGLEYDLHARATHFSAKLKTANEGDWDLWRATVRYTTDWGSGSATLPTNPGFPSGHPDQQKQGAATDPEQEPMDVEWDWEDISFTPYKDLDGKFFLNKAHQRFAQDPTFNYPCQVLVVSRNEMSFKRETHRKWANAVNSDTFMGELAERVMCKPPRVRLANRGSMEYWRVTYRLVFPPDLPGEMWRDWQPQYLNQGTHRLQTNILFDNYGKAVPVWRGCRAVTEPVLLDNNGQDMAGTDTTPPTPIWLRFKIYRPYSFAELFTQGVGGP